MWSHLHRHRVLQLPLLGILSALTPLDGCGTAGPDGQGPADGSTHPVTCEAGAYVSAMGDCLPAGTAELFHEFGEQTTQPGEEVVGRCRSWTLGNDTDLLVNAVHFMQSEGSHHSNFEFVPETAFTGPDGFWSCNDRGYDFYTATSMGGVLYAQSTQATDELEKFPDGVVIRVPAHSRVISDVHLINTSDTPLTGYAKMSIVTLPAEQVKTELHPFHIEYNDLHIPARGGARFTGTCDVAATVSAATGKPFAPKLYYTIPHTHKWGKSVFLEVLGGPNDGLKVFEVGAYNGEAHGEAYRPPIDLAGASGFRYGCEYANSGSTEITYGFASGEMCEIFGFVEDAPFFWAKVDQGMAAGTEGSVSLFTGSCIPSVKSPAK